MVGRLLPHEVQPAIRQFMSGITQAAPRPWLRPLQATLDPPGTGLLGTLEGHSHPVNGVAVSLDGRRAVSASSDRTLKVWDLETGRPMATFSCDYPASCCTFAGARMAVAGDSSGRLHFLSLELDDDTAILLPFRSPGLGATSSETSDPP
jgi:WD40 repeat protein